MIWSILVPGKHGMAVLMLVLKEDETNAEAITVRMNKYPTITKYQEEKC